ncbi:tyrosine-protein phosphatase [Rhodococcus sp. H29-C3]|uniref:tyrosine-protein phosphatase n=1 Tax=Rhodococcus sp. H29-C3 TaxID=3046307 RepID=UPI0024BAC099|nr:tyrosine-protein phosphatase [Rhodococcus sp. H29-C3]MDJ0362799.1 tyrosine-protein phosphatase [Rhodococcus sp. H29-C3]
MSKLSSSNQFRLSGAWNFRDVGGARTEDGRAVRSGVLFRSSELSRLNERGRTEIRRLGVTTVFDLRGEAEIARSGADRLPGGVHLRNTPYRNHRSASAPHEGGASRGEDDQIGSMLRTYSSYSSLEGAYTAIREIVTALAAGEGPILVHCAAGKDRAGWSVATVLRAVGVSDADIVADFLRSNSGIEPLRRHMQAVWSTQGNENPIEPSDAMLGVREQYYRRGLETVDQVHGSFEGYLHAIGIGDAVLADLRGALLTDWSNHFS